METTSQPSEMNQNKILIETPYPALKVKGYTFRETVYGIVKRLRFFLKHI